MKLSPAWMDLPETRRLIDAFNASGAPFRFVGGCVRDALLNRPVQDIDIATPLKPEQVETVLTEAGLAALPTGIDHGTMTAVIGHRHFEITTLRRDVETFGRHATVAYTDDWKEDAARRDFTMNAFYLSPEGELFDYFGGETDARAGRVRFIGEPHHRIREDYLRILRFFRFYAHYGKGEPDSGALDACHAHAAHIQELSGERIQHEMMKLLASPKPHGALMHMEGVLTHTFGFHVTGLDAVARLEKIEDALHVHAPPYARLALLLFRSDVAPKEALERVTSRWKLSSNLHSRLNILITQLPQVQAGMTVPAQKKLLRKLGAELFKPLAMLRWAMEEDAPEQAYRVMLALADGWTPPIFPLGGRDLEAVGMEPGPKMGEALRRLEEEWEMSDYTLTKEQLLKKAD